MKMLLIFFKDFKDNYNLGPDLFWKWFLFTILIGTIGFWAPLVQYLRLEYDNVFNRVILSGNISTFCIVVLAETLGYYEIQKRKDINVSKAFPALITCLLIVNAVIYAMTIGSIKRIDVIIVCIISLITLPVIIFSFAYRNIETIDDAGEVAKEDDKRVEHSTAKISKEEKINPIPPKKGKK